MLSSAPCQTRTPLPYTRARDNLPSALPTQDAIARAPTLRDDGFGKRVAIVGKSYVVKHGSRVTENEGNVLLFIEKYLDIPAPRLHAMYRGEDELYLVMDRLEGRSLGKVWPDLDETQKERITDELKGILSKMRSLLSPTFYGSISKGPLQHRFFLTREPVPDINGPFDDEEQFSAALAKQASLDCPPETEQYSKWLLHHLQKMLHGHSSVLTHSDLHQNNILVSRRDGQFAVRYITPVHHSSR